MWVVRHCTLLKEVLSFHQLKKERGKVSERISYSLLNRHVYMQIKE